MELTSEKLAEALATIDNPWADGIEIDGARFPIDYAASDALAARMGHEGRNESESRWLVVAGAEVEYVDGIGWRPASPMAGAQTPPDLLAELKLDTGGLERAVEAATGPLYEAELRWTEAVDEDGIPRALEGECVVLVRDDDDDRDVETLYVPVSGLPETLDEQLDSALSAAGWRRTEDIRSWTDQDVAHGRCAVARAPR